MAEKIINYKTKGTCSSQIEIVLDDDIVKSVKYTGGCNGNLKGISALVADMPAEKVISLLEGTKCGFKETSCPDQLARALKSAINKE